MIEKSEVAEIYNKNTKILKEAIDQKGKEKGRHPASGTPQAAGSAGDCVGCAGAGLAGEI